MAYVIGGQKVYEQTINLPVTNVLEITEVHSEYEGDRYFPEIKKDRWKEVFREDKENFSFVRYERNA